MPGMKSKVGQLVYSLNEGFGYIAFIYNHCLLDNIVSVVWLKDFSQKPIPWRGSFISTSNTLVKLLLKNTNCKINSAYFKTSIRSISDLTIFPYHI